MRAFDQPYRRRPDRHLYTAWTRRNTIRQTGLDLTLTPVVSTHPTGGLSAWYSPIWYSPDYLPTVPADLTKIKEAFEKSVVRLCI